MSIFATPNTARRRNARLWRKTHVSAEDLQAYTPWPKTPVGRSTLRRTRWTCLGFSSIGILAVGAMIATAILSIPKHKYCLVLDEQFDGPLDTSIWQHEIQVGGFGNGEFEMTTDSPNNSFVEDGKLYIVPTLSSDIYGMDAIMDNYVLNLTAQGICTGDKVADCVTGSNNTWGNYSVLPPISSARLTTKLSKSIKYGRVEVQAKMPTGDWIWPAIDIAESRGNAVKNWWDKNVNVVNTALHWGLDSNTDRYAKTRGSYTVKRDYSNAKFNTYGLDWDSKGVRFWANLKSRFMGKFNFDQPFWERGNLASATVNGSVATNPWLSAENANAAPFDQEFYLILSVAVGGTNGWFEDSGNKPWSNGAPNAARDFWVNRNKWLPTWPEDPKERGMAIESVKIWRIAEPGEQCQA
ncbi:hypothetical protein Rhopal_004681-T1 [Rhodotorula paludigena]|uniref:GH16 domain-containing protein n=1 Tax=Rhodotorula paludigena TaxID=86838 RepID=A0AAV5GSP4_9BASI|nr:hypothetical protein Rhopal_004681-T1 [Rhodotorula paludigena]